jgi:hypothetical protein
MHYMKTGNKVRARESFNRYLTLASKDAGDRAYVQQYISSLK